MSLPILVPIDLELLLHCHIYPELHPRHLAPGFVEAKSKLERCGMIKWVQDLEGPGYFKTTDKGVAFVKMLCKTKEPIPAWLDNEGMIIHF